MGDSSTNETTDGTTIEPLDASASSPPSGSHAGLSSHHASMLVRRSPRVSLRKQAMNNNNATTASTGSMFGTTPQMFNNTLSSLPSPSDWFHQRRLDSPATARTTSAEVVPTVTLDSGNSDFKKPPVRSTSLRDRQPLGSSSRAAGRKSGDDAEQSTSHAAGGSSSSDNSPAGMHRTPPGAIDSIIAPPKGSPRDQLHRLMGKYQPGTNNNKTSPGSLHISRWHSDSAAGADPSILSTISNRSPSQPQSAHPPTTSAAAHETSADTLGLPTVGAPLLSAHHAFTIPHPHASTLEKLQRLLQTSSHTTFTYSVDQLHYLLLNLQTTGADIQSIDAAVTSLLHNITAEQTRHRTAGSSENGQVCSPATNSSPQVEAVKAMLLRALVASSSASPILSSTTANSKHTDHSTARSSTSTGTATSSAEVKRQLQLQRISQSLQLASRLPEPLTAHDASVLTVTRNASNGTASKLEPSNNSLNVPSTQPTVLTASQSAPPGPGAAFPLSTLHAAAAGQSLPSIDPALFAPPGYAQLASLTNAPDTTLAHLLTSQALQHQWFAQRDSVSSTQGTLKLEPPSAVGQAAPSTSDEADHADMDDDDGSADGSDADGEGDTKMVNSKGETVPGSSCHQCKTRRVDNDLYFCSMSHMKKGRPKQRKDERLCRKKYCLRCIVKFYGETPPPHPGPLPLNSWACFGCRDLCSCAACKRQRTRRAAKVLKQQAKEAQKAALKAAKAASKQLAQQHQQQQKAAIQTQQQQQRATHTPAPQLKDEPSLAASLHDDPAHAEAFNQMAHLVRSGTNSLGGSMKQSASKHELSTAAGQLPADAAMHYAAANQLQPQMLTSPQQHQLQNALLQHFQLQEQQRQATLAMSRPLASSSGTGSSFDEHERMLLQQQQILQLQQQQVNQLLQQHQQAAMQQQAQQLQQHLLAAQQQERDQQQPPAASSSQIPLPQLPSLQPADQSAQPAANQSNDNGGSTSDSKQIAIQLNGGDAGANPPANQQESALQQVQQSLIQSSFPLLPQTPQTGYAALQSPWLPNQPLMQFSPAFASRSFYPTHSPMMPVNRFASVASNAGVSPYLNPYTITSPPQQFDALQMQLQLQAGTSPFTANRHVSPNSQQTTLSANTAQTNGTSAVMSEESPAAFFRHLGSMTY